jgi:DNA-binding sugar fermentation-stimulating protein
MQALAPGALVDRGKRFAADVSENELKNWASRWL